MVSPLKTDSRFSLTPEQAESIAERFGTPCYVVDETHLRNRMREWVDAFAEVAPGGQLTFASKANSQLAILAIAHQEGLMIDVASEGELRAALAAGVPANRCHLHGNNKSRSEIAFAMSVGVHEIVVDHFSEVEAIASTGGNCPDLIIRLAPAVDPITHEKISTGQADTKFGFNISDGSAEKALVRCLELDLPVAGFHCHVGSQLLDPGAQRAGGAAIADFAVAMHQKHRFAARVLNVGGGLGVRYREDDAPLSIAEYNRLVIGAMREALAGTGLDPIFMQEPGRSVVAESGVTLYRVGVRKTVPTASGSRTYLGVDGGLSDNPRPALYGSVYPVRDFHGSESLSSYTISGKHCETDRLFTDVSLSANVAEGDLLQVLCTGAYNASMASNYNRFPRPNTVLIQTNGELCEIARRDSWDEMFARESVPQFGVRAHQ